MSPTITSSQAKTRVWDGTTTLKYPTTCVGVQAASGNNIIGATASKKHRLFLVTISVDTAGTITLSDCTTLKAYMAANTSITLDFGAVGFLQGTSNTAIQCTNSGGGNFTAVALYSDE